MPLKNGIHLRIGETWRRWIPAFDGMTECGCYVIHISNLLALPGCISQTIAKGMPHKINILLIPIFSRFSRSRLKGTSKNSFSAAAGCEFYCASLQSTNHSGFASFVRLAQRILAGASLEN